MNKKVQSISLALGGFFIILMLMVGKIEFNWIGFIYVSFCMVIGFINWIEVDKEK